MKRLIKQCFAILIVSAVGGCVNNSQTSEGKAFQAEITRKALAQMEESDKQTIRSSQNYYERIEAGIARYSDLELGDSGAECKVILASRIGSFVSDTNGVPKNITENESLPYSWPAFKNCQYSGTILWSHFDEKNHGCVIVEISTRFFEKVYSFDKYGNRTESGYNPTDVAKQLSIPVCRIGPGKFDFAIRWN